MSCKSCKNGDTKLSVFQKNPNNKKREVEPTAKDFGFQIFNYAIRVILFVICLLATPLIMVFVVYILFKTVVLNKGDINITPLLLEIAKGLGIGKKKNVEDEYPEDYEDLDVNNPDEYESAERIDKIEL